MPVAMAFIVTCGLRAHDCGPALPVYSYNHVVVGDGWRNPVSGYPVSGLGCWGREGVTAAAFAVSAAVVLAAPGHALEDCGVGMDYDYDTGQCQPWVPVGVNFDPAIPVPVPEFGFNPSLQVNFPDLVPNVDLGVPNLVPNIHADVPNIAPEVRVPDVVPDVHVPEVRVPEVAPEVPAAVPEGRVPGVRVPAVRAREIHVRR